MKKKILIISIITVLLSLGVVAYALATGYLPNGNQSSSSIGTPGTKGEARSYVAGLKGHDDRLRSGNAADIARFWQKLGQDKGIEKQVAELAAGCKPCPIVYLPAPDPVGAFEELIEITVPDIQGNDDEPLSDIDRANIDAMEKTHDENQDKFLRNDEKKMNYLLYFEARIAYYAHPEIKCPEPVVVTVPEPEVPWVPWTPWTPWTPEEQYKRNNVQTNPTTGASSSDPAIVDLPGSPPPEPPANPTSPADEPY